MAQLDALTRQHQDGQEWQNYRAALICTVIASVNRNKKQKAFQPKDFMPKRARKKLSTDDMLEQLRALNAAYGGEEIISESEVNGSL